jgi:hypothetical protein
LSAHDVTDVPPGVVTVTSTVPVPPGDFTVILVSLTTVKLVASFEPNFTAVAPVKPEPVMVTEVPPDVGPEAGEMAVTVGPAAVYVNLSADVFAEVPPGVVTVTSSVPVPAGDFTVIWLSFTTTRLVADVLSNFTDVAPVKPDPVIVTEVPPAAGPVAGEMAVTVGTVTYVNLSADDVADVPPEVVTVTSTVPVPAGDFAVIDVAVFHVIDPDVLPNFTAVALPRLVPVIVTEVPPDVGPEAGEMAVTVGPAAVYVNLSAAVFAEVPPGVVTVTSSVPVPAGDFTVIWVSLTTTRLVAAV